MATEMDHDAIEWLARWNKIASREGLRLSADGDRWRLDPVPTAGAMGEPQTSITEDVRRLPDGRVVTHRMTREEVEAFFGPDDGAI